MSVARTWAVALAGIAGRLVEVEADVGAQLPRFSIIGLADRSLGEAGDRVRQAAANAGCPLPARRLTVNLAPADLPKHGTAFDLAIAVASLAAGGLIEPSRIAGAVHVGELALDGRIRPVPGVLSAAVAAAASGRSRIVVPAECEREARLAGGGIEVVAASSLRALLAGYGADVAPGADDDPSAAQDAGPAPAPDTGPPVDLSDVIGQADAVGAIEIAAAGRHHLAFTGPPGAGKSMLAARLPGVLPDLDDDAAREATMVQSLAQPGAVTSLRRRPPFEAPHHTISQAGLVGGGAGVVRPGAVTRASGGVLLLDEAAEFAPGTLNALRQPLETGEVVISRAQLRVRLPARVQLVLASNPCPCGNAGSRDAECRCTPDAVRRYRARLSGPVLDRVDLRVAVPALRSAATAAPGRPSADVRRRVLAARDAASARWGGGVGANGAVPGRVLRSAARLPPVGARRAIDRALDRGELTMRGYDRVLRVAWTIADLDGAGSPNASHLDQALFYRRAS